MKAVRVIAAVFLIAGSADLMAQQGSDMPSRRAALARAASADTNNLQAAADYAEFLDRYSDPGTRDAYAKMLAAAQHANDKARAGEAARRMARLDLLAGNGDAAARDVEAYQAATGKTSGYRQTRRRRSMAHGADSRPAAFVRAHGRDFAGFANRGIFCRPWPTT